MAAEPVSRAPSVDPQTQILLDAIAGLEQRLTQRMDGMGKVILAMNQTVGDINERLARVEGTVGEINERLTRVEDEAP